VSENNLHRFGSSQDDDPKSKPAATKTYDVLWLIDLPNGKKQLCVFTAARTGAQPTENMFSTSRAMGIDYFYQRYQISQVKRQGPTGDVYFSFEYRYLGPVETAEEGAFNRRLWQQYSKSGFIVDKEDEPAPTPTSQERDRATLDDDDQVPF
jgi:hypothetical protein